LLPCMSGRREVWRAGGAVCAHGVGHAARNVYLQAVLPELGTVVVGAFSDDEVERLPQMQDDERALCIMPVGRD